MRRIMICFLPDADPVKPGEEFGAGTNAVIKNGKAAMKAGFSVSVKAIPMDESICTVQHFR